MNATCQKATPQCYTGSTKRLDDAEQESLQEILLLKYWLKLLCPSIDSELKLGRCIIKIRPTS